MKKLLFLFFSLFLTNNVFAQISLPQLSPLQKIEQRVGLTDLTVVYSRPAMRGRVIFGALVPFNKYWRTGANRNTKITFSEKVSIGNQEVPAGTYALFTRPSMGEWTIYLYEATDNWDVPEVIDTNLIVAKINAKPISLNRTLENLTITFDDMTDNSLNLGIAWERTYLSFPIQVMTSKIMAERLEKANDENALAYHLAGYYYLRENIKLAEAKKLFEKAILLNPEPDYRNYLQLSYVLEKLEDIKGAIQVGKKSLELAKQDGSKIGIEENTENLKKWGVALKE